MEPPLRTLEQIEADIAAQRARRPKGWAQRCGRCRYWEYDDDDGREESEDSVGECHRYAPRIVHHHTAQALGLIAWAVEAIANIEHEEHFDYNYESKDGEWMEWPIVSAHEWCGDFADVSTGFP